jgi:hypothetical protein
MEEYQKTGIIQKQFDGVLFIPVKEDYFVLVFKTYHGPFRRVEKRELCIRGTDRVYKVERRTTNCLVYWNGEFFEDSLPPIVEKCYPGIFAPMLELCSEFTELPMPRPNKNGQGYIIPVSLAYRDFDYVKDTKVSYDPKVFPKGCFELKLSWLLNRQLWPLEMKSREKKRYWFGRDFLRKSGFISEMRGKNKKPSVKSNERDAKIVEIYKGLVKKTGIKKPYPIKRIQELLPYGPVYDVSCATIRRALRSAERKCYMK